MPLKLGSTPSHTRSRYCVPSEHPVTEQGENDVQLPQVQFRLSMDIKCI